VSLVVTDRPARRTNIFELPSDGPAEVGARGVWTVPNLVSFVRLALLPVFLWLLFGQDNRFGAALLLGFIGATDWVDGYIARRFNQVSEFGKVLDPAVDRAILVFGVGGIIVAEAAPWWFSAAVVIREVLLGIAIVVATAFGMARFSVSWWGKTATFLLFMAFPFFLWGSSDQWGHQGAEVMAWVTGLPGLVLSWYTAITYIPLIRDGLREGRRNRSSAASAGTDVSHSDTARGHS
jgi:cardiolipin synthase (CMP-forming)